LNSFAVVDLTGGKSKDVLRALFRKMEEHGMEDFQVVKPLMDVFIWLWI
jgi:hypothetical protein